MTERQKELLMELSNILFELAEECLNDDVFHGLMINNNDLIPMSLDDFALEWKAVAEGRRQGEV